MALTDTAIKQAKPKEKDYKLSDERGLFLLVKTTGAKYWRWKYRVSGREKVLAFGVYPEISLKEARDLRDDARAKLRKGIDPGAERKAVKAAGKEAAENTFRAIALEWFAKMEGGWSDATRERQKGLLENHLFPPLGGLPVKDVTPALLLQALRKVEARGTLEAAARCKQVAGAVFRYAVATGRADRDPSGDLRGALKTPKVKHLASITEPRAFGALLRAIDGLSGNEIVRTAMRLAPHVFQRPGEVRQMEWLELDLDAAMWALPPEKMKMRRPHLVPLSTQAVELLRELQGLTGAGRYVFPGELGRDRPMSENTMAAALRRLGYSSDEMTAHGFRASARTMLDEVLEFEPHLIEAQLAHEVKDANGRAYNRTKHLPQRKAMMQRWSDYLDELKAGNVVPMRRAK